MSQARTAPASLGETVRAFLLGPLDRPCFDRFFELCYTHSRGYLRYLQSRGFQLPLEPRAEGDPLDDLAIDVLGPFLQSTPEQPFAVIVDYFRRSGITEPGQADPEDLYHHFTVLLRGFVRKELGRLKGQADPQLDNLKRRFKDLLKEVPYATFTSDGDHREYVCLAEVQSQLNADRPRIASERLAELVETAYLESSNRTQWCRRVFDLLQAEAGVRNCVYKHELLSAVIHVNLQHCDQDGIRPAPLEPTDHGLLLREIHDARVAALEFLRRDTLADFIAKDRISGEEARRFEYAFELYAADLAHAGQANLFPAYFREVMPEEAHDEYLRRYKYVFETAMNAALDHFRGHLKKSATWLNHGAYLS